MPPPSFSRWGHWLRSVWCSLNNYLVSFLLKVELALKGIQDYMGATNICLV